MAFFLRKKQTLERTLGMASGVKVVDGFEEKGLGLQQIGALALMRSSISFSGGRDASSMHCLGECSS